MVFLPNQFFFLLTRKHNIFFLSAQKQIIFFPEMSVTNFFFQNMFKDPFNCETGMRGMVTCRHTVAYRVHADALISATKHGLYCVLGDPCAASFNS